MGAGAATQASGGRKHGTTWQEGRRHHSDGCMDLQSSGRVTGVGYFPKGSEHHPTRSWAELEVLLPTFWGKRYYGRSYIGGAYVGGGYGGGGFSGGDGGGGCGGGDGGEC